VPKKRRVCRVEELTPELDRCYFARRKFLIAETSILASPGASIVVSARHSNVYGAGVANIDVSAIKNFRLGEVTTVQFRSEFFNATNTPFLALPGER